MLVESGITTPRSTSTGSVEPNPEDIQDFRQLIEKARLPCVLAAAMELHEKKSSGIDHKDEADVKQ